MSTRATWGFVHGGETRATYCHSDGYPDYLGKRVLAFLRESRDLDALRSQVEGLRIVDPNEEVSEADVAAWGHLGHLRTAGFGSDWYALIHALQDDPALTMAEGIMADGADAVSSVDWSYVINLDTEEFIVLRWGDEVGCWQLGLLPPEQELLDLN